jgi:DNA polymerase-3 subunit beta
MEGSGSKLILRATDLEIGCENVIDVDVIEEGSITIPAGCLSRIVPKLDGNDVIIKTNSDNSESVLKCNKSRFELKSLPADDFPLFKYSSDAKFSINGNLLFDAIEKTIDFTSKEMSKEILTGIRFLIRDDILEFVATDGYRLSIAKYSGINENVNIAVILPYRAMLEIKRVLEKERGEVVEIENAINQVIFKIGNKRIFTRTIQGSYPEYKNVFPSDLDRVARIDRLLFMQTLERVSAISVDKLTVVKLTFDNSSLDLESTSLELGKSKETIEIEYAGKRTEIRFNARFLLDSLKIWGGKEIVIEFSDCKPAVLREEGSDNAVLLMPIRSNE